MHGNSIAGFSGCGVFSAAFHLVAVGSVRHGLSISSWGSISNHDWGIGESTDLPWGMGGQLWVVIVGGDLN